MYLFACGSFSPKNPTLGCPATECFPSWRSAVRSIPGASAVGPALRGQPHRVSAQSHHDKQCSSRITRVYRNVLFHFNRTVETEVITESGSVIQWDSTDRAVWPAQLPVAGEPLLKEQQNIQDSSRSLQGPQEVTGYKVTFRVFQIHRHPGNYIRRLFQWKSFSTPRSTGY